MPPQRSERPASNVAEFVRYQPRRACDSPPSSTRRWHFRAAPRRKADCLTPSFAWSRNVLLSSVGIVIIVIAAAIVLRTEIVASDPWDYIRASRNFPDLNWVPLGYTRHGMILPRLPLVWLFGNSQMTYNFWPILSSGVLAGLLYLLAFRFWGPVFGVAAVVLGFASPTVFINMSRGYPDIQSAAIITGAVTMALILRDRAASRRASPAWLWVALGLVLGFGFETRETTILVWPIVAVALGVRAISFRRLALVGAGIAAWAVTDIVVSGVYYGDPLAHLHVFTSQDLATTQVAGDQLAKSQLVGRNRYFYFVTILETLARSSTGRWSLFLGALAVLGLLFRGGGRFAAVWVVWAYVTIVGITGGFNPDHPSGRIDVQRYWICFLPVVGLAAAGTTAEIVRRLRSEGRIRGRRATRSRAWLTSSVAVAMALAVAVGPTAALVKYADRQPELVINGADQLSQLRTYLALNKHDDARVLTDFATARLLPIYQRGPFGGPDLWAGQVLNIATRTGKPQPGDLVVINSMHSNSCFFCRLQINDWIKRYGLIPGSWIPVWRSSHDNLVVYRVPTESPGDAQPK